jgi:hypothetical protein
LDSDFHERDLTHKYGPTYTSGVSKRIVVGIALGAFVGGLAGFTKGCSEIRGIATGLRAHGQFVCGTGFPIIVLGITVFGVLLGSLFGLLIGWAAGRRCVKRNPIGFFNLLLVLILESIALWLLFISSGDLSDIGRYRAGIASAFSQLGFTFLIPTFFTLRRRFRSPGAEHTAASLDWSRLRRSFVMAERVAFSIWVAILALALALVIAALSGKQGLTFIRLEGIVVALNLVACVCAIVMALVIPSEH